MFFIFMLFIFNITIHSLVENSNVKVPDFRWAKTRCIPSYSYWINNFNNAKLYDMSVNPYGSDVECWVLHNDISFVQPFLSNDFLLLADILLFMISMYIF